MPFFFYGIQCSYFFLSPATSDYVAVSGQLLTFSSTNTRETVEITVTDDSTSEGIEQFLASLNFVGTPVDGIRLVPNQATVRINDNDSKSLHTPSLH